MSDKIACIVLAAGASRRFGSAKLLHTLPEGHSLFSQTLNIYASVFSSIHVVIGNQDNLVNQELIDLLTHHSAAAKLQLVQNAHAEDGMSQSIVAGVNATADAAGWLVTLGDMPYVQAATVRALVAALQPDSIVMPRYRDQTGNPVGFGREFRAELQALQGDKGAKSITRAALQKVQFIDVDDEGILQDIDRPEDIISS
ncbi:MAG: nucleotidyltransferase family protein [Pseudomonadota bacterium]